jgi:hypothetical protein
MFRDESINFNDDTTTTAVHSPRDVRADKAERHREIDRALRQIASQRCGLEVEEARWLRVADAEGAWRKLGYVHALEYLEEVFGYRPRTAKDRLRVARALGDMPQLEKELANGTLNYSVVRELSRVAKPSTVGRWIERARGKNLREVEQIVSGRKKGDDPDDAPDPDLVDHRVTLELDAVHHALWRDLRKGLAEEFGRSLDDKELVAEIHARAFGMSSSVREMPTDGSSPIAASSTAFVPEMRADRSSPIEASTTTNAIEVVDAAARQAPRRLIHVSTCPDCRRAWRDGAGIRMQISAQAFERAKCDALVCDDDRETRVTSGIPERIRRKVMERDGYKCTFPGCRSARNLEVHHVEHREDGGDHDPPNLTTLCAGHHQHHHDGVITIAGRAPDALTFMRDGRPVGVVLEGSSPDEPSQLASSSPHEPSKFARSSPHEPSKFAQVEVRTLAKAALTQAGFRPAIAKHAVEVACAHVGTGADLTALIKEALRHCG